MWFFKGLPSRIGHLLDISLRDLERILYFEAYVVIDPGDDRARSRTSCSPRSATASCATSTGDALQVAQMGAEAIKELLQRVDVETLADELRDDRCSTETSARSSSSKAAKRLKVVDAFRKSGNRPEWMILDVIPVIPPELRPLVPLDGGRFATSDLNDLYRRVINRNNRLKKLIELQRARRHRPQREAHAPGSGGRALRQRPPRPRAARAEQPAARSRCPTRSRASRGASARTCSASASTTRAARSSSSGPELKLHQCGLPKKMALELFKPFIYNKLEEKGLVADHQGRPRRWSSRSVPRCGTSSRRSSASTRCC